jgi:DNA topoisomerase-1
MTKRATKQKGTTLVIVESPAKAKTIEKYLGKDYIVRASIGHIRDLPKSNAKAIDIEGGFVPHYEITAGKDKVIQELKRLASNAREVLLATDPDREGEAIAWHIVETLGLRHPKRIVFHEITQRAIAEAVKHPRDIDQNLRRAQEARRVLDRLVGYDLSSIIWKKVRYGLSAGRVQSPALRIIMEREREIRAFVPEAFWRIQATLSPSERPPVVFFAAEDVKDEALAHRIVQEGRNSPWSVVSVKETETTRSPRAPFTTSTLQQAASTRLSMSPSRTMQVAQKLYEAGLITYMRTDSTNLAKESRDAILSVIERTYGKAYVQPREYKTRSKNAQEAHEAIRPTDPQRMRAGTTPEQQRLYALIWQRSIASQMADARMLKTKIIARYDGAAAEIPDFVANGSQMLFPGWLSADPDAEGEEIILPKLSAGEALTLVSLDSEQRYTEPPSRYTEAGLVKELEKRGIGRPSTYASILKTLVDRGYVTKEGKTLFPTDTGEVVSAFLEEHFAPYISDTFTAEMEQELDDIAEGKREYATMLHAFYDPFRAEVWAKDKISKATNLGAADPSIRCPKCGAEMIIKLAKSGRFLSCSRFPECDGARTIDGKELEGPKPIGEKCPECGNDLVEREGRFGKFIACSNYPKCKFIKKDESAALLNSTGVKCPICGQGEMIPRKGRFGIFFSCSNYPKCKHAIKAKPTGAFCQLCSSLMMEGTKTIPERCSNRACPNHNPHKRMQ